MENSQLNDQADGELKLIHETHKSLSVEACEFDVGTINSTANNSINNNIQNKNQGDDLLFNTVETGDIPLQNNPPQNNLQSNTQSQLKKKPSLAALGLGTIGNISKGVGKAMGSIRPVPKTAIMSTKPEEQNSQQNQQPAIPIPVMIPLPISPNAKSNPSSRSPSPNPNPLSPPLQQSVSHLNNPSNLAKTNQTNIQISTNSNPKLSQVSGNVNINLPQIPANVNINLPQAPTNVNINTQTTAQYPNQTVPTSSNALEAIPNLSHIPPSSQQQNTPTIQIETETIYDFLIPHLRDPTLFIDIAKTQQNKEADPIVDAIQKHFHQHPFGPMTLPPSQRSLPTFNPSPVPNTMIYFWKQLESFLNANSYHAVLKLSRYVLTGDTSPDKKYESNFFLSFNEVLVWWYIRLYALEKLSLIDILGLELTRVVDVLFNQSSIDPQLIRLEAIDIFLVWARYPSLTSNDINESLNRAYDLLLHAHLFSISEPSVLKWNKYAQKIRSFIISRLLSVKEYNLVTLHLKDILKSLGHQPLDPSSSSLVSLMQLTPQRKQYQEDIMVALASLIRVYLLEGDVGAAGQSVEELINVGKASGKEESDLIVSTCALVAMASGDTPRALSTFAKLASVTPHPAFKNNLSVLHLYSGDANSATAALESCLGTLPPSSATGPSVVPPMFAVQGDFVFNLATLYDLCDGSFERKRRFLGSVLTKRGGDNFDISNLKV